jgi:glycosyltransferase involved in cell wall biosynthesis
MYKKNCGDNNPPRISVIMPNLNGARFLEETILSVLTQGYSNLEYIICDGGSTDGSVKIIQEHEKSLAYWCSERDEGQADAFHKGCHFATGEILYWLDSDDVLLPGALETVGRYFLAHPEIEAVSAGCKSIDEHGRLAGSAFGCYSLGVRASYRRFITFGQDGVFQQGVFWKRTAYEAVGGVDIHWQFINDLELFSRLAERKRFGRLPKIIALRRLHSAAKSFTIEHIRIAEERAWRCSHSNCEARGWRRSFWFCLYRSHNLATKMWLRFLRLSRVVHV